MISEQPEDGYLLLVNKPLEWTSFDVVKKLRHTLKVKKIGHAGTLDPLATGLLIIGVGKFTKKLNELQGLDKEYQGILEIGKTTPSYDLETEFDSASDFSHLKEADFNNAVQLLTGEIKQIPPAHSAVKIDGKRAYKMARKNEEVVLKSRKVVIYSFDINIKKMPLIEFKVKCSKGTYIRSLVNDFGKILGVGAYLKGLERTAIGDYVLEEAEELEDIVAKWK